MTEPKKIIYLKIQSKKNNIELPKEVNIGFDNGNFTYYIINQVSFISPQMLEDDDIDLNKELKIASAKIEKIVNDLSNKGCEIITSNEYKNSEKEMHQLQQNTFISNFTDDEKIVYERTKKFADEYDLSLPGQKQFLSSLRPFIAQGDIINELYLEEHALKFKKNVDKIFDCGVQGMICNFITDVQKEIENSNKQNKVKKTKKN